VPGMFIANGVDEAPTAMPVAPIRRPGPRPRRAAAAGTQRGRPNWDQGERRNRMGHSPSPTREHGLCKDLYATQRAGWGTN